MASPAISAPNAANRTVISEISCFIIR
jgi:hypothetical protein